MNKNRKPRILFDGEPQELTVDGWKKLINVNPDGLSLTMNPEEKSWLMGLKTSSAIYIFREEMIRLPSVQRVPGSDTGGSNGSRS